MVSKKIEILFFGLCISINYKQANQKMFEFKVMYCSPKGNAGLTETIAKLNTLEETIEMWKSYCETNSTQEYFDEEGYNCFYIEDEDGDIVEAFDTGFYEEEEEMKETCSVCKLTKTIDNIMCIQFKPIMVWKCCDCIYLDLEKEYNL